MLNPSKLEPLTNSLKKLREYCVVSNDSVYGSQSVEVVSLIDELLEGISEGKIDRSMLSSLIAPTSSLQEITIDNDWGGEFNQLARKLDLKC